MKRVAFRTSRWTLSSAVVGVVFAASAPSAAASALTWRAPSSADCPTPAWATQSLRRLTSEEETPQRTHVPVDVSIERGARGRWRAHVVTRSASGGGERDVEGETCARVAEAALLIVAIALGPMELTARAHEVGLLQPSAAGTRLALGVLLSGDLASLPAPTLGAGFFVEVVRDRLRGRADFSAWLPRTERAGPNPISGADVGLQAVSVVGCVDAIELLRERLRLGPCLGVEAGLTTGRGVGLRYPRRSRDPWGAATVAVTLHQNQPDWPLQAWISLGAGYVPFRTAYTVEGYGTVFEAAPVFGRLIVGLSWTFL
jgi:hypothetical protein